MDGNLTFSGAHLRRIRHKNGWSQAELARRAGVRERQIIRWENNQNEPRLEAVGLLAHATGETVDAFFGNGAMSSDEDEEESEPMADLLAALAPLARLLEKAGARS